MYLIEIFLPMFDNAGAYGAVMASTYNLRDLPRELVLAEDPV